MPQAQQLTYVEVDFVRGRVHTAENFAAVMGYSLSTGREIDLATATRVALEHVTPHERKRVEDEVREILQTSSVSKIQFEALAGDRGRRFIETICFIDYGDDGKPVRAVATCFDSTASSLAEQTLRESEARYRTALTAGRMGSWETDLVARTRTWSSEGMALFGLDLPEGRGQVGGDADEYVNALHPADRHLAQTYLELADQQDAFTAEYRIVRPDGQMLWLSGRGLVVARRADGRAQRLVSIMADVTERRQAEEILRIERGRLAQALQAGQMGAYDLNIGDDVLWWSPQMYSVFGVNPETFTPTRASVAALLHPDDLPSFMKIREDAIRHHRAFTHEFRILRPDGTIAWLGHLGQAEYDSEGQPVRSFGVAFDITKRKRAELALHDADRMKDNFIATLAHELRNPLAPIRNAVNLLRQAAHLDPQVAWSQEVIDRQVGQMTHLLDDLLDVSRMTRGQFHLRREPLDLARVIASAIEIAQPLIGAAGHTLAVSLPTYPIRLEGDLTRLTQVFSNLLINAAKYTQPRGRIEVGAFEEGHEVVVTVTDTGIGIGPEQLPHIFKMFGQVESALDRSQGGIGIGLSLAKGLIEMHGGRISAASEGVGKGAEFVVRLPVSASVRVDDLADTGAPADETGNERYRILVADDVRDSADTLAKLLEAMGHTVSVAYDGAQALEVAEVFRPEVVLLDLGMPRLNGYETCRRIRSQTWGRTVTLIAQTGWGQEQDRRRTMDAGFDHHIVKPIDAQELTLLLRSERRNAPPRGGA